MLYLYDNPIAVIDLMLDDLRIKRFLIDIYLQIKQKISQVYTNISIPFSTNSAIIDSIDGKSYLYEILKATDNHETVIVTRKGEKNVVIMSLERYNQLEKAARNAEYLAMVDRGIAQLSAGRGQEHELIEEDE